MSVKAPLYLPEKTWEAMEFHLLSVMDTLSPKATSIAQALVDQFPNCGIKANSLRHYEQVKTFVQGMRASDMAHVADKMVDESFEKIEGSETEFVETERGATFKGTYEVGQFESPEAYLKHKNIDLEKYQITKMGLKTYQGLVKDSSKEPRIVTMNSIFCEFKPKVAHTAENAVKELLEAFKSYIQPVPRFTYQKQEQCAAIINLLDAHIDKVCLVTETGFGSTIEDNIGEFERLFDQLLTDCIKYQPELIIFPIGHDFFNTNGPQNSTKKFTPQATSIQSHDSFSIGVPVIRRCIDKAKQVAKVKVFVIRGNHDEDKDFYMGKVLEAVYEQDANVEIENSRLQRKYEPYGVNLFGFAHGDKEANKVNNLPLLMAEEKKKEWAETSYRYFFLGDKHHTMEYKFLRSKDFIGCLVKFLRSIGTTDQWHYDNGYIGIPRTGEVEIHSKQGGMIGHHFAHAQYREKAA